MEPFPNFHSCLGGMSRSLGPPAFQTPIHARTARVMTEQYTKQDLDLARNMRGLFPLFWMFTLWLTQCI